MKRNHTVGLPDWRRRWGAVAMPLLLIGILALFLLIFFTAVLLRR